MNEALIADPVRSKQILERIPAGRWGTAEDFEGAIVFLASRASDYVSGECLVVDGGWMGSESFYSYQFEHLLIIQDKSHDLSFHSGLSLHALLYILYCSSTRFQELGQTRPFLSYIICY